MTQGHSLATPGHGSRWRYAATLFLACLAGWVDAVSFVRWNGLYVSFMSGNTTSFAVSTILHRWSEAGRRVSVLAAFVVGVVCGELFGRWAQRKRFNFVALAEASLLAVSAMIAHTTASAMLVPVLLALAMGVQNTVLRRAAGFSIALTYITGTMVRFGRAVVSAICRDTSWKHAILYAGVWLAFVCGALAGAETAIDRSDTGAMLVPALLLSGFAFWKPLRRRTG